MVYLWYFILLKCLCFQKNPPLKQLLNFMGNQNCSGVFQSQITMRHQTGMWIVFNTMRALPACSLFLMMTISIQEELIWCHFLKNVVGKNHGEERKILLFRMNFYSYIFFIFSEYLLQSTLNPTSVFIFKSITLRNPFVLQ